MVTEICSSSNLWIRKSELTVNIVFLQTFRRRATKNKPGWPNWQRHFCCGVFIEVVTKQKLEGEKIHLFILITCPPPKINPDYSRTCSNRSQKFTCYENRIFGSENQSQFSPASVQCPLNEVCCTYHAEPKILDSLYCRIASKMPNYFRVPITLEIWLVTIFFFQVYTTVCITPITSFGDLHERFRLWIMQFLQLSYCDFHSHFCMKYTLNIGASFQPRVSSALDTYSNLLDSTRRRLAVVPNPHQRKLDGFVEN